MKNRREFVKMGIGGLGMAMFAPNVLFSANSLESLKAANKGKEGRALSENFVLNNGMKIPKIGLGVWKIDDNIVEDVIAEAFKIGYRHIDTAQAYGNERGVGEAVRKSRLKREEIFVTSKIRAEYKDYKSAMESLDNSLHTMGLSEIDLMLIHSPQPWSNFRGGDYFSENVEVYHALEDALKSGKVRAIGVSNFLEKDLENIFKNCSTKPAVNQILTHIGNTPFDLIDYCKEQEVLVEAYSPIAHGRLTKDAKIIQMSQKYNVTPAQLCVRYALSIGTLPLPKSKNPVHIAQNAAVDFELSNEDLEFLKNFNFNDYGEFSHYPSFKKR
ncbi:aldo/keto reductase [Campylobacter cuniculorum]|uniref:Aldo/keto reductase n=2 Tax=Campylobacter cuniculorum TaxID=374106 RepID=A0A1W6BZC2_9BACT|nr:aldo/keto reductase [Campylobacter cuniculorum]ARJ57453.1 aldo/keto reductase [Campylobacter cuniculorum DSM 23162 = LMG 24588]